MWSIFVTLTASILLVSINSLSRRTFAHNASPLSQRHGVALSWLCCAAFSAHAAARTATTTQTCSPACTSDPYSSSASHSWVDNYRHGLEVSARSRWAGLSTVALNSSEPLPRTHQLVDLIVEKTSLHWTFQQSFGACQNLILRGARIKNSLWCSLWFEV